MRRKITPKTAVSKLSLALFVVVFAAIGGYILLYSKAATPGGGQANIWVAANGSDSGANCVRFSTAVANPDSSGTSDCASLGQAFTLAQGGDTIVMSCGSYPAQTLSGSAKASPVTIKAANYTQATTAFDAYTATTCTTVLSLTINTDKVHIYGLQATPQPVSWSPARNDAQLQYQGGGSLTINGQPATDILVDGWHGRNAQINNSNVTVDHSSFGFFDSCYDATGTHITGSGSGVQDGFRFWNGGSGVATPSNDTIRNSVVSNIIMGVNDGEESTVCNLGSTNGPHSDCMQNNGGIDMTVDSDIFFNCPSQDVQWEPFSGATVGGTYTIQNNFFGARNLSIGAKGTPGNLTCNGITIRNNYLGSGVNPDCSGGGTIDIYGNYLPTSCYNGGVAAYVNYHDNVVGSGSCGTAYKVCTPAFVSPPTGQNYANPVLPDPRLLSSDTCLKGADTAPAAPASDIYGLGGFECRW